MSRSQGIVIGNIGATILDLETEFERARIMTYPLGDWLHNKISRQEYKEKMAIYRDKQAQYVAKRLFEIYGFEIAQKYSQIMCKILFPAWEQMDNAIYIARSLENADNKSLHTIFEK